MVYHPISADMKRRALQLLEDGWEMNEIADVLGMSSKSIDRWQDNYETHGRVNPPSFLRGRRCILSAGVVDDLRDLMRESPELYLDKIGIWLTLYHKSRYQPLPCMIISGNWDLHASSCAMQQPNETMNCVPAGCTIS